MVAFEWMLDIEMGFCSGPPLFYIHSQFVGTSGLFGVFLFLFSFLGGWVSTEAVTACSDLLVKENTNGPRPSVSGLVPEMLPCFTSGAQPTTVEMKNTAETKFDTQISEWHLKSYPSGRVTRLSRTWHPIPPRAWRTWRKEAHPHLSQSNAPPQLVRTVTSSPST